MRLIVAIVALLVGSSCHRRSDGEFPRLLSEWGLFQGQLSKLDVAAGVLPYDLNTPLFSDYATKRRVVRLPKGAAARYDAREAFEFPVGTVIAKTFSYEERIIETRILVNTADGWKGLPYVWNEAQTDATLEIAPDPVNVEYRGQRIRYMIPNQNQCKGCHERAKRMVPIGPKARHLNRDYAYAEGSENQLVHWTKAGLLTGAPESITAAPQNAVWNDAASGTLEQRARAYLDVNCAHCHNPEGPADTSGLFLGADQPDPLHLGFCKVPVAAGHGAGDLRFDLVQGSPDESILVRRMDSVEPKVAMPELGRSTIHREGVALIREWVSSVRGTCN